MFEKSKLSFWDISTYLFIGFFIVLVISVYGYLQYPEKIEGIEAIINKLSVIMILVIPMLCIFIGMIEEPISNYFIKFVEANIKYFQYESGRNILEVTKIIDSILTLENTVIRYRYCKSLVEKNIQNPKHELYLSRYGFYRSMSFNFLCLFFFNFYEKIIMPLINIDIHSLTSKSFWFMFVVETIIFLVLFCFFLKRAQRFKSHMEYSVYYDFLAIYYDLIHIEGAKKC